MPDLLPSCLKPKDKGANLGATKGMSTESKARKYDQIRPGVQIPDAQKAERIDLMRHRDENGINNPRRKRTVGTFSLSGLRDDLWCKCGKFKHEGECQ